MTVKRTCEPDKSKMGVVLEVTKGEYLMYEVTFLGAQALFMISDQHGELIMSPATPTPTPGKYSTKWPSPNKPPKVPDDLNHALGLQFLTATEYRYTITHHAKDGTVISVRKRCSYVREAETDSFFEPFRILTT